MGSDQNVEGTSSDVLIFLGISLSTPFVSPPLFDSDVVKLLYTQRSRLMRLQFLKFPDLNLPQCCVWLCHH